MPLVALMNLKISLEKAGWKAFRCSDLLFGRYDINPSTRLGKPSGREANMEWGLSCEI